MKPAAAKAVHSPHTQAVDGRPKRTSQSDPVAGAAKTASPALAARRREHPRSCIRRDKQPKRSEFCGPPEWQKKASEGPRVDYLS